MAKVQEGKTFGQVAEEMGINRRTVGRIMSKPEVQAAVQEIDQRLANAIPDAIQTILDAVKLDYKAARDLLKNFGSMKETVELTHNYPKPMVLRLDGKEIAKLGTENDEDEDNG